MANKKKTEDANVEATNPENIIQNEQETQSPETQSIANDKVNENQEVKTETGKDPSPRVLEIMRLYPQYEEIWITPNGFVHPKNAAAHCIKGAVLYKNKYYQK